VTRGGAGAGPLTRLVLRACAVATVLAGAGCSQGPDHERLGDRRYAEHSFVDALAEYRLAMRQPSPPPELRAKFAAAALHVGALTEAVAAYRDLAAADAASQDAAADGLVHAARLAIEARDVAALGQAVTALRQLQPDLVLGGLATAFSASDEPGGRPSDALDILLQGAAVSAPGKADSLLVLYGDLNVQLMQLDAAQRAYESVLRRSPSRALGQAARAGLVRCAIDRGRDALGAGFLDDALEWFGKAVKAGEPDSLVRVAWLLTGDARWAGGDTARAAEAYRRAAAGGGADDPTALRATEQLQKLFGGGYR
jgi:tetratricopeptide (TPR) repeat protein